jgi:hypothetical protein
MEDIIYYRSTRRAKIGKSINHVFVGVLLLLIGVESLLHQETKHLVFDILSIVAGAALIFSFVHELRRPEKAEHPRISWVDIFAGIVILLEAWHTYRPAKWFQPAILLVLVGIVTIGIGLLHHKLSRLARLKCDERGFFSRSSVRRSLCMTWNDVAAVQYEPTAILITTCGGRKRRIRLRRFANREEISAFFDQHWQRASSKEKQPAN